MNQFDLRARVQLFSTELLDRRRNVLLAFLTSLIPWAVLALLLLIWNPASWPWNRPVITYEGRAIPLGLSKWDVALFIWITELLLIKSYLMWARTRIMTWLGFSLIAVNLAFAAAYYSALVQTFWPLYEHKNLVQLAIRLLLALTVTWAVIRLLMTTDSDDANARSARRLIKLLQQEAESNRAQIAAMHVQIAVLSEQNSVLANVNLGNA
jgi:hypothetical protein